MYFKRAPLSQDETTSNKKVMRESAKKLGIKNPILEIPLEVD